MKNSNKKTKIGNLNFAFNFQPISQLRSQNQNRLTDSITIPVIDINTKLFKNNYYKER